jgi:septum formation topological specificity factor MinE
MSILESLDKYQLAKIAGNSEETAKLKLRLLIADRKNAYIRLLMLASLRAGNVVAPQNTNN